MSNSKKVIKLPVQQGAKERHQKAADYYASQVAESSNKPETINQCIAHLLMTLGAK